MTTATLHSDIQRSRFVQLAFGALSRLASSALSRPAASLTAAASASIEAQRVRELAYSYSKTDPGFAADLYAAAARHEGLVEA
jgi:hypothetical protein